MNLLNVIGKDALKGIGRLMREMDTLKRSIHRLTAHGPAPPLATTLPAPTQSSTSAPLPAPTSALPLPATTLPATTLPAPPTATPQAPVAPPPPATSTVAPLATTPPAPTSATPNAAAPPSSVAAASTQHSNFRPFYGSSSTSNVDSTY